MLDKRDLKLELSDRLINDLIDSFGDHNKDLMMHITGAYQKAFDKVQELDNLEFNILSELEAELGNVRVIQ